MFTKWQQVENWIRDNGLSSWRFLFDRTGIQSTEDGEKQTRSNRVAVISDNFPGDIEEKMALTKRRLLEESNKTLYGYGRRGKENTGLMYCEVRLVDEFQQPGAQAVGSPSVPPYDEEKMIARIRKEVKMEFENQRYKDERKSFEAEKKEFEEEKKSAIGLLVRHLSPVLSAMAGTNKRVAGVDSASPVNAAPIHAVEEDDHEDYLFTDEESDKLFALMARFKQVEPRYLELIERVVTMAESGDSTYDMAKGFLLK